MKKRKYPNSINIFCEWVVDFENKDIIKFNFGRYVIGSDGVKVSAILDNHIRKFTQKTVEEINKLNEN